MLAALGALCTGLALGVYDHFTGRMPNWLTGGSLLVACVVRVAFEGAEGIQSALIGMAVTVTVPLLFYWLSHGDALGGGDVKALAALGAWLGPSLGLEVELLSFMLLALAGVVRELRRGTLGRLVLESTRLLRRGVRDGSVDLRRTQMRFGPYLALGTVLGVASAHFAPPDVLSLFL